MSFDTRSPSTGGIVRVGPSPNTQLTARPVVRERMRRQLCPIKSSGLLGMPLAHKYPGAAHTMKRIGAISRTTMLLSRARRS